MRWLLLPALLTGLGCIAQVPVSTLPPRPQPQELAQLLHALEPPADSAPVDVLYARGLQLAAAQQFYAEPQAAAATVRHLDAALDKLPAPSPAQRESIAAARRQYRLLGAKLPYIPLAESLFAANETPRINTDYGSATILLLFPDTCSACVEMARGLRAALFRESERNVHLYGLLAQSLPPVDTPDEALPRTARSGQARSRTFVAPPDPRLPASILRGTPTMLVTGATLAQFGATSFPFAIATDSHGVVRYLGPAPPLPLLPGSFVDQLAAHIARLWPPDAAKFSPE